MQSGQGSPSVRPRTKTYSAASGYVYQYQFVGQTSTAGGEVYRFATTQDRRSVYDVSVVLTPETLRDTEADARRAFTPTERYAIAKMAFFAALDAAEDPTKIPRPIAPAMEQVGEILQELDL